MDSDGIRINIHPIRILGEVIKILKILWTKEEEKLLKQMANMRITIRDMMLVLKNRSEDSIRHKLKKLGIKKFGPEPQIDYEEFKKMKRIAKL